MIKLPKFETESQEADWWYDNRHLVEEEFLKAIKAGAKPGPSRALRHLADARGISVEEMRSTMRREREESDLLNKLPRSA